MLLGCLKYFIYLTFAVGYVTRMFEIFHLSNVVLVVFIFENLFIQNFKK